MKAADLENQFRRKAVRTGASYLSFDNQTAKELVEACRAAGIAILGVEGYDPIGPEGTDLRPRADWIADWSILSGLPWIEFVAQSADASRSFLEAAGREPALLFKFVLKDA